MKISQLKKELIKDEIEVLNNLFHQETKKDLKEAQAKVRYSFKECKTIDDLVNVYLNMGGYDEKEAYELINNKLN
jgi:hypothetical protein